MAEVKGQVREEQRDPERELRRRTALAQIRQYPDQALRMRANEVEGFDDALALLVDRMSRLMQDAAGIGLAAPQIGILQRVVVYQPDPEAAVVALVNPRAVDASDELGVEEEGCLSLGAAGVVVEVERPVAVTAEAASPGGEPVRIEAEALEARVLQHELDHLDGILTIDRTTPEQRREALARLRPEPVLGPLA